MRKTLILFPLLLFATPAVAQPAPPFIDPSIAGNLANAAQAIFMSFLLKSLMLG